MQGDHESGDIGDIGTDRQLLHHRKGMGIAGSADAEPAWILGAVRDDVVALLAARALPP